MVLTAVHGLPRIGAGRELKAATEAYWAGRAGADELLATARALRAEQWRRLATAGIDHIPSNTFSLYDHVLDTTDLFGALPKRFRTTTDGESSRSGDGLGAYFAAARGEAGTPALAMTKWFDTNYHYLVPELGLDTEFTLAGRKPLEELAEAAALGVTTTPVLVGPVTYLLLSKAASDSPGFDPLRLLDPLLDRYAELLAALGHAGATWVHLDEPAFAADRDAADLEALRHAYRRLGELSERPRLGVRTYFGDAGPALPILLDAPVEGVGLDLCRGRDDLRTLRTLGRPALAGKVLFAGVVNGRDVWINDLRASLDTLTELADLCDEVAVSTSCSLQHVPIDKRLERDLDAELLSWLSFAEQKVDEVALLARGLREGPHAIAKQLSANQAALATRRVSPRVYDARVRGRLATGHGAHARRASEYPGRRAAQDARLHLPPVPTTTIGSFPQTRELRVARAAFQRGDLAKDQYDLTIRTEIEHVVALQERLGFDVLVHGEPERSDMVAYFAEQLQGFAATRNGWVQSFGTRYVRPPILFGDVSRPAPMTVRWTTFAQSLTAKPVKGMLTGPLTLLLWSFVRDDQPLATTCAQLALAISDEVADLQDAGIAVIQVDEPALREGLPLRHNRRAGYLAWATACFRLATAAARDDVQIHTHMCYADFDDILDAVDDLDADVISMEAARAAAHLHRQLADFGYRRQVGPGAYDIHSPVVPTTEEILDRLRAAAAVLPIDQLWANPDCGLKTRDYEQVVPALNNLVAAARQLRAENAGPS